MPVKRIGITQRVDIIEAIGERRDALSQEWSYFLKECGYLPIFLPNDVELALKLAQELKIDGILLTGGNHLFAYGGNAKERDDTELALIEYGIKQGIGILGVCRGMQVLLHYFGQKLVPVENHVAKVHRLQSGKEVNSYHSFGAIKCELPLLVKEVCEDGVIEQVVHHSIPNICGIMWHPERYSPFRIEDIQLVKGVFER